MSDISAHPYPLFQKQPFQITDQDDVVEDRQDTLGPGIIFLKEAAAVDQDKGLAASRGNRKTFRSLSVGISRPQSLQGAFGPLITQFDTIREISHSRELTMFVLPVGSTPS